MNLRTYPFAVGVAIVHVSLASLVSQERFVVANGERIYYEVEGQGDPLVLIHGWSLNLRMWDLQVPDFAREYQVIRLDRRGFGRSTGAEDSTWNVEDLRRLLDELGVKRAHVLGMSQGAGVALTFAVAFPERVSSLILHGAPPPGDFGLPSTGPDRLSQAELRTLAKTRGLDAARRAWGAHPLMEIPTGHQEARNRLFELLAAYRGGLWLNPVPASGPTKSASMADLARVQVPTLVLVGEREIPYLQIVADVLTYGIAGARKVLIPVGGHMVNIVEPQRYNQAVLEFLRGVRMQR